MSGIPPMNRPTRTLASLSKILVKSQTVRPRAKRAAKTIGKSTANVGDPFALSTEWSGDADENAYAEM